MPDILSISSPKIDVAVSDIAINYLNTLDFKNLPDLRKIVEDVFVNTQAAFAIRNQNVNKAAKWPIPNSLFPLQIALIISNCCPVCRVECGGNNSDEDKYPFAVYQHDGKNAGLYATSDSALDRLIRVCDHLISVHDIKEVKSHLKLLVPIRSQNENPDLIAVANGIFDFRTKTLLPFSPEHVFLSKSRVAYNPDAVNVVIHNDNDGTDWDVESWIKELFDDPELVDLTWEILSAIIRPYVRWNKMVLLYATDGCNGKGTLCQLLRNLCGSWVSIPMAQFGDRFGLASLMGALAVIVDENRVGSYLEESEELKAAITHNVVHIEKKGKDTVDYIFHGLIVQCVNQLDRTRDKSDSFYRRLLIVPFNKTFQNAERKYIKDDYLNRKDVLEYILYRVLHMDHYEFSEPRACKLALGVFKEANETVLQFANEMLPQCSWDLLPFGFLFDLYREWMRRNCPSSEVLSKNNFIDSVLKIVESNPEWTCRGRKTPVRPQGRMDWPEPLIDEYHLTGWGGAVSGYYTTKHLKSNYIGLIRVHPIGPPNQPSVGPIEPIPTN